MAEVVWSEPAIADLDAIADYIAIENPRAAAAFVARVFVHVERLADHPASGRRPPELPGSRYREIVEPPCRVFYRHEGPRVLIVHVMRFERLLRIERLGVRARTAGNRPRDCD
ncbi:type II toxin-antitoxin system RelE/ParE family toxin [Luteimonas sp. TWI662]|uniref:type II toxin-antitoxin system RelE/ParE family toxin n=1 Tax=unclassified Luteimonas TaxID=2629088 RepID=UPI0032088FB0